jgi:glycosyltransferase involved in cell wall biosynthesis
VVLLTNILPPYRLAFYNALAQRVNLTVIVDALSTPDRLWTVDPHQCQFQLIVAGGAALRVVRKGAGDHREDRYIHVGHQVFKHLRRLRPDIIVSGELGLRTVQALIYRKLWRTPVVCYWEGTPHTEASASMMRTLWRKALLGGIDAVWVNGVESAAYLQRLGVPRDSMTSAMTGVDTEFFWQQNRFERLQSARRRADLGLKGLVFGYSGSLSSRKGIASYLEACHRLLLAQPHAEFSLLFVGEGAERGLIEQWRVDHPSVTVQITGFVQLEELPGLYSCVDWFVMPTLEDCWALTTVEILACGLPQILSPYNGATADLKCFEGAGIVADPFYPDSLHDALAQALVQGPRRVPEESAQLVRSTYSSVAQAARATASLQKLAIRFGSTRSGAGRAIPVRDRYE